MKVVIASAHVPFIVGGGTRIVDDLDRALSAAGHTTEIVSLPVWETWDQLPAQLLAFRLIDIHASADRLIAIRTPSHLLRHPSKVVWFLHHHRGAYDLWGTEYQDIPDTTEGRLVRSLVMKSDDLAFAEAQAIFANSPTTRERLRKFNGIDAPVLYPPLSSADDYYCNANEGYVFLPSRINTIKRQSLAVQAMSHVRSGTRLIIAGPPDTPQALENLERLIEEHNLKDRVTLLSRWISEQEKRDLFANCLGCLFIPYDEDSYGYVGLEACHSRKPLVTCTDSGGVTSLVVDEKTGFIVEPSPHEIGEAIDRLAADPRQSREMGQNAHQQLAILGISWHRVVEALTN